MIRNVSYIVYLLSPVRLPNQPLGHYLNTRGAMTVADIQTPEYVERLARKVQGMKEITKRSGP